MDFKIENTKMVISPGPPLTIRFFIQYNAQNDPPKLQAIRFNGKEICNVDHQLLESETPTRYDINDGVRIRTDITSTTTTVRPKTTTQRTTERDTLKPQYWTQAKPVNNYQIKSETNQQTTSKPQQTKSENNQQVKSGDRLQTTVKPQYWTQKSQDKTQTTSKTPVWPHVKVDNIQNVKSDTKLQTKPDDRLQATTANKLQSTGNRWSQTKVENNQQTSNQDKNTKNIEKQQTASENYSKSRPESLSQVVHEVTTQSQLWAQFKVDSKQQTGSDDRLHTKNDNKSPTLNPSWPDKQQGSTVTKSQTVQQVTDSQYWPKITVEDNQQIKSDGLETSQQTRPDRFQSTPYERLQTRPADSNQDLDRPRENSPVYVRPDEALSIQQARPNDSYQHRTSDEERFEARPIKRQNVDTEGRYTWSDEITPGEKTQSRTQQGKPKDRVIFESAGTASR